MNTSVKRRSVAIFCALSVAIALSSCSKKADNTATAPSPAMSAAPSTTAASPKPSSMSSMAPQAEPALSASASKLGVKPTNENTCPSTAPVKGKVTKKRGDIYHVAKEPDFARIKPEICFKDTATAEKAGFRAPKNVSP